MFKYKHLNYSSKLKIKFCQVYLWQSGDRLTPSPLNHPSSLSIPVTKVHLWLWVKQWVIPCKPTSFHPCSHWCPRRLKAQAAATQRPKHFSSEPIRSWKSMWSSPRMVTGDAPLSKQHITFCRVGNREEEPQDKNTKKKNQKCKIIQKS